MKTSKKLLSLFLAFVLATSCFSVCAFALIPNADTGTLLWFSDDTAYEVDEYIENISNAAAPNYRTLRISNIPGVNFSAALQKLTGLTKIEFKNCDIIDISWLSYGTNLSTINLSNNLIYDLSVFSTIQTVPTLDLSNNLITNVAPLINSSSSPYLHLNLDNNFITDARPLKKCSFVSGTNLHLVDNYITGDVVNYLSGISFTYSNPDNVIIPDDPFLALQESNGNANTYKIIGYYGDINDKEAVIDTTVQVFNKQTRQTTAVDVDENQQNSVLRIEKNAFRNNVTVESWIIGNKVSFIDGYAFSRCTQMKRIKLGTGITTIKGFTFYYCPSLLGICIPDNVITVEARAFDYCTRLKYIEFSNGNTSVHSNTFSRCNEEYLTVYASSDIENWSSSTLKSSLDNLLIDPTIDRYYKFKDGELKGVTLTSTVLRVPAGIDRIDFDVQNNNNTYTVKTFIMPEGVTFASINLIPQSDTPVEILVPSTLSDLSGINYPTGTNVTAYKYGVDAQISNNNGYTVNGDYKIAYDVLEEYTTNSQNDIEVIVPPFDFDTIDVRAFYGIGSNNSYNSLGDHITDIKLPDGIVEIKSSAFRRLRVLESITFGSDGSLRRIAEGAFGYDYALSSINIPQSVTTIGANAFEFCTNLESVSFGADSQLSTIGVEIFKNCTKLRNNNPDAVANDVDYRFFKVPDLVESISQHAFSYINGENKFSTIELPENVNVSTDIVSMTAFEGTNISNVTVRVYCEYYSDFYYDLLDLGFYDVVCLGLPNNSLNSNPERISRLNASDENQTAVLELNAYVNQLIDDYIKACENGSFDIELLDYEIAFTLSTNKEIQ